MTHEEAQQILEEWADELADDSYKLWGGFDLTGPIVFELQPFQEAIEMTVLVRLF